MLQQDVFAHLCVSDNPRKHHNMAAGVVTETEGTQSCDQYRGQKRGTTPFTSLRNENDNHGRQQND